MKLSIITASAFMAESVSAFSSFSSSSFSSFSSTTTTRASSALIAARPFTSSQIYQYATAEEGLVNVADIYSPRDVYSMEEWASQYGMQKADGVELYSEDGGSDYSLMTQSGMAAGQTVVWVPASIVLNSASVQQEFGASLQAAEAVLEQVDERKGTHSHYRLPLLRLMVKILAEWEKGQESMYYPWLNSLPREFFNGVSMTKRCFNCLPPYAGWLASTERINYGHFNMALKQGNVPLSYETSSNRGVVKWAYNIALTRYHEVWQPERAKVIGPMADMLNHASQPNCEISVDYEGNVNVVALYDIPAGSPLTISLGDPTNPTPIFAQYGFLPQDCATIFCKAMHLEQRIMVLGYEFGELLIQTETGEIAPKVWDVFLYDLLQKHEPGSAHEFCMACRNNDEATKQSYHDQYFAYTLASLKEHIYSIMSDAENLTAKAQLYDLQSHPRVPVIVAHNQLVIQTFGMTATLLEQMG
eukprot:CAMPEP_0183742846 /NCGR_PEP_ID=MMETSP0737-20130205/64907_1 /TAXON_ID=385413 /ORGANISM="Thalassiosira miniscula, Strain CCMP1093" /LENGTH=472 /DNA_ID=CAMNT_0025978441 /DNA_START=42 /DNA_END=1460 /DNA_ORIENTATION=+